MTNLEDGESPQHREWRLKAEREADRFLRERFPELAIRLEVKDAEKTES